MFCLNSFYLSLSSSKRFLLPKNSSSKRSKIKIANIVYPCSLVTLEKYFSRYSRNFAEIPL
jgi:hypothetical protein